MRMKLLDGTGHAELRYVYQDLSRHGKVRVYFWRGRGSPKIRLLSPVGSAAFLAEYRAAFEAVHVKAQSRKVEAGSFAWLCAEYMRCGEYAQLAPSSKTRIRNVLKRVCTEHGPKPVAMMEPRHVRAIRDTKATRPGAANEFVKVMRSMFRWAVEAGHVQSNPVASVPKLRYAVKGFHSWTENEVRQFEARHTQGTKARLAMMLLLYTGVRRSDVVNFGRQMEQDGALRFRQVKTKKWLTIPILAVLREEIDRHAQGMTYLLTSHGKPFTAAGFGNWFRERCNEAGLSHCSAHGLRKAGATIAAQNGATAYELQAIYGWASAKEAEPYTRTVDQKKLAAASIHKLERK